MKVKVSVVFALSLLAGYYLAPAALLLPFALGALYAVYGVLTSIRAKLDPLNDLPNAFRVFLSSLGGVLIPSPVGSNNFILPSIGILVYFSSIFLNDEFQRRAVDSIRKGRLGGSVALLGIDGSGKSSHALLTREWLERRGYRSVLMPFHRYLFVEKLSSARYALRGQRSASRRGGNPFRPLLSLFDNMILQLSSSFGCRLEGTVVLYDRFMWSTYIKYFALGYPVRPLSTFYLLPRPTCAVVLDVPVDRSLKVIYSRESHIRYPRAILETERELYLRMARERGYPVVDSTKSSETVQLQIERYLSRLFPTVTVGGGGRSS